MMTLDQLKSHIREIPDFPEKGILFRDITTLLKDPNALRESIVHLNRAVYGIPFDYVVAPESRGFIFGMPVAYEMDKGFIPVRKKGKLPAETIAKEYDLEYGKATIEIHKDALKPGDKVVIVDDLLATGGTAKAIKELVESTGATVSKFVFLIELEGLNGKELLGDTPYASVIKY